MDKFKKTLLIIGSILFFSNAIASDDTPVHLENPNVNIRDTQSVERGAKFFAQHCMICHSVKYLRHNELAQKAGITLDKMPLKDQDWWFGVAPPDLSLITRVRSPEWVYTYLHSFYTDPKRAVGSNNLIMENSSMPNPFGGMQGEQELTVPLEDIHKLHGIYSGKPYYYEVLRMTKQGSMTPEEFDNVTRDVVNFLVYTSDPNKVARNRMGFWVLGFLFLFLIVSFLLKKEYWKKVE